LERWIEKIVTRTNHRMKIRVSVRKSEDCGRISNWGEADRVQLRGIGVNGKEQVPVLERRYFEPG
jgi:hypothetical protein